MQIEYVQHKHIDKLRWDNTISAALNGNLYAYSWYLDIVCPGWDALISDDYWMIMPLTGNRKYGISYIFRPMLSQQLGLFSLSEISTEDVDLFIGAIPAKYRLIQYCLNKTNFPSPPLNTTTHTTFELDLKQDYKKIISAYSENHRRNIKKTASSGMEVIEDLNKKDFIDLLLTDSSPGSKILSEKKNLAKFSSLIESMHAKGAIRILGLNNQESRLIAGVLFGHSHNTWIYLAPVNTEEGKEKRALFTLIDYLIRTRSGKEEILDFEGSDIPGLAQFYSGFGAVPNHYTEILKNTLPWPIKYLK